MAHILAPHIREAIKTFAQGRQITMNNNYHLRLLTMAQSSELHDILKDRNISRWVAKFAYNYNPEQAIAWCKNSELKAKEGAELFLGLFDNESEKLVAVIGLRPESDTDGTTKAEIGYIIAKEYHGKKIAVKLVDIISKFAFKELGVSKIYSTTAEGNLANQYVLLRSGYENHGKTIVETNGRNPRISALYVLNNPLYQ